MTPPLCIHMTRKGKGMGRVIPVALQAQRMASRIRAGAEHSQAAIVAAAHESAAHIEGRHGRASLSGGELSSEWIATLHLIQLDHGILGAVGVKCLFGLDAEGSCGEGEHDGRLSNVVLELCPDCSLIVVASL
jgi:hypothetical protein